MNSYSLTRSNFKDIFDRLSAEYRLFGPKRLAGRGRFSDTDLITCDFLADIDELEFEEKSFMSPKSVVFPADETTFVFNEEEFKEPLMRDQREIIVFLRPCDINGFARLDKIFLENGDRVDPYYQRRRQKIHFFMIECSSSFENCFCVAMQSNHTDNYAVALRFDKESIEIQIRNDHFNRFFESFGTKSAFTPEFVKEDAVKVELPDNDEMPAEIFNHQMWSEYDQRCIACGRCNTSCVTCTCFSTVDIFYPDSRTCGERRRVWDGCHLDGFTEMAGGHSFRKNKGDRMRFKTLHKIYDFRKRFGFDMCVGCGRCDDVCPEYISFSSCINKLGSTLKGEKA